ncbi:MAG: molybdopterin-dependent oxidoreductase [Verrucomicrobia bacterium]|nr:molybdopterin-dependent oxidoreductase [Verrucomicrobiota bacterium]
MPPEESPTAPLPPGQRARGDFPRFGLTQFANRFPAETARINLQLEGEVAESVTIGEELRELARVELTADFHCVTTWTTRGLRWSGFRFADFHERLVLPRARPAASAQFVILRGQDGARTSLPLADLLAPDVLLADRLHGEPLSLAHGAPLRLVAPAHYGYKNAKHLSRVAFWSDDRHFRPSAFRFMDHPRARVAFEERGRYFPGWFLRLLYRPLVGPTIRLFARRLEERRRSGAG